MNRQRLSQILNETTIQLRKGDIVTEEQVGPLQVTTIDAMPHADDLKINENFEKVDMEFLFIGVDKRKAAQHKDELLAILATYPHQERLAAGLSYIEIGAEIGDQGMAFQLFAVGKVLGFWGIISPVTLGFEGEKARILAGSGFIMTSGFNKSPQTS
jgi:hypothetical protein